MTIELTDNERLTMELLQRRSKRDAAPEGETSVNSENTEAESDQSEPAETNQEQEPETDAGQQELDTVRNEDVATSTDTVIGPSDEPERGNRFARERVQKRKTEMEELRARIDLLSQELQLAKQQKQAPEQQQAPEIPDPIVDPQGYAQYVSNMVRDVEQRAQRHAQEQIRPFLLQESLRGYDDMKQKAAQFDASTADVAKFLEDQSAEYIINSYPNASREQMEMAFKEDMAALFAAARRDGYPETPEGYALYLKSVAVRLGYRPQQAAASAQPMAQKAALRPADKERLKQSATSTVGIPGGGSKPSVAKKSPLELAAMARNDDKITSYLATLR